MLEVLNKIKEDLSYETPVCDQNEGQRGACNESEQPALDEGHDI